MSRLTRMVEYVMLNEMARILSSSRSRKGVKKASLLDPFLKVAFVTMLMLGIGIVIYILTNQQGEIRSHATAPYGFGTLQTDPAKAAQESAAGIKVAMLEFGWDIYEPSENSFNQSYIDQQKQKIQAYKAAGMQVVLAFGLHYPPSWVFNYADSRYIDQNGSSASQVNLIFNQVLRQKAEVYMQHIASDLGIRNFSAIRIHSGGDPELLYPSGDHQFWAYDRNAQNGAALPTSIPRNPFPGWKPGDRSLTTAQVAQWYDWYIQALDDSAKWQMNVFTNAGFSGQFQMLTPGSGTRPDGLQNTINNYLNTSGDQTTGRGAAWQKVYQFLPHTSQIVAYVSSMADGSGNNDSCDPSDRNYSLSDTRMNSWSATRWISRIADEYGLAKSGENPGYPNTSYGPTMMQNTARQMSSCNYQGMFWAHEHNLYDGQGGVTLQNYADLIKSYNPTGTPIPSPTRVTPTSTPFPSATPTSGIVDNTSPTVSITSPTQNAVLSRGSTVTLAATANDNVSVSKVAFYVNNSLVCSITSLPYSCSWRIGGKPNARYTIKAIAYDQSNNNSSATMTITAR